MLQLWSLGQHHDYVEQPRWQIASVRSVRTQGWWDWSQLLILCVPMVAATRRHVKSKLTVQNQMANRSNKCTRACVDFKSELQQVHECNGITQNQSIIFRIVPVTPASCKRSHMNEIGLVRQTLAQGSTQTKVKSQAWADGWDCQLIVF